MKEKKDYIQDIAEMRLMMERSSKFLSLSGWAGIMAGIYALAGAWIAWKFLDFHPGETGYNSYAAGIIPSGLQKLILLATLILVMALSTAIFLSYRKSVKRGEQIWNATARRLLFNMAVPLVAGGLLILIFIFKGLIAFIAPFTLLFYGLALFTAGKFTYDEVRFLGMIQIALGLISSWYVEYGLIFWAIGFGIVHIIYGVYIHIRYER